ncbi:hypothetical protein PV328_005912 [Microctonus aethiopoides]|uniref:XPG N-terminal domain-containing protein n=1 Tax=Microctonus aethiopoides TaxID=144406 RepID=A0AA39KSZ4_9HYME|nr:hypothetical protein PV328_005912 [Microctonus aethiopoides]
MGISGLTKYIKERGSYLEPFEIDNTSLVIDGYNLTANLYATCKSCNHLFGGDYDQFFHVVFQFFNDLLQCKVTPLVILDGGWERKKTKTIIKRFSQQIESARGISHSTSTLNPPLLGTIFIDVLDKLEIRYAMCIFEADDAISSIAKNLNVPILSSDADFFLCGANFIPYYGYESRLSRYARGYVKKCLIYRIEKLLERFQGLDITVLPLASILMGNDYVDSSIFDAFFRHMKITMATKQQRIEAIFDWLKNHSLNTAIIAILKCLPVEKRENILHLIETIVNDFSKPPAVMLSLFNISEQSISEQLNNFTPFKFQGSLNNLEDIDDSIDNDVKYNNFPAQYQNSDESNELVECSDFVDENLNVSLEEWNEEKLVASLPQWFVNDHLAGKFPGYFVNILTDRICKVSLQYEDFSYCSARVISFPILTKICSLLITRKDCKISNTNTVIELLIRDGDKLGYQKLPVPLSTVSLDDVRNLSESERKKIINETLQIHDDDKLDKLPPSWQLYVAAILYWMRQDNDIKLTNVHLRALLISMLIGIIDRTIGFNRPKNINQTQVRQTLNNLFLDGINKKKYQKIIGDDKSMLMMNLINSISKEDCASALPFFLEHSDLNNESSRFKQSGDNIIHVYSQFQSCLAHAMDLNALLGGIYVQPSPSEFFNGTLIYNVYSKFSTQSDVDTYIATRLNDSPGLLQIFKTLHKMISDALKSCNN